MRGEPLYFSGNNITGFFLLLLMPELDIRNIHPIMSEGIAPVAKGSLQMMGWCSELFIMTFFLPYVSDPQKVRKYGFLSALGIAAFFTYVNLIALLLLGQDLGNKIYPLLIAFRYVNVGFFLENLEAIVLSMWVIGHFLQVGIFFYAGTLSFAHCFQLSDYRPFVFPIGLLCLAAGLWDLPNYSVFISMVQTAVPFHILSVYFIIPLLLLIIALIRKRKTSGTEKV
ncbi:GerAB/ArcD/ProY family transporter [Paenibacillus senegalensis]|uniref:GerAB/ArcD/ProY family transporter n=1 Tax=Paenibacillus senegalensis TaxID=1465766 RepID=UPI0002EBE114|nr:GerAB/ArcD/ProY family transporter [Paenibacillus senegalensis]